MIGIIGYGMVGKALSIAFKSTEQIIVDPAHGDTTIGDLIKQKPIVVFVCVPTPTDDSNYEVLKSVLTQLKSYDGLVVVKSTILPHYIEDYDVVYNPEFLSRATAYKDLINPPMVVLGGDMEKCKRVLTIYKQYTPLQSNNIFLTDIKTAAMVKYTMNTFYATKITFMNAIYDVANKVGADYDQLTDILSVHPWMGNHHFQVPGPDGQRGFGGPCLPKDTAALAYEYDIKLLKEVLNLNLEHRHGSN